MLQIALFSERAHKFPACAVGLAIVRDSTADRRVIGDGGDCLLHVLADVSGQGLRESAVVARSLRIVGQTGFA